MKKFTVEIAFSDAVHETIADIREAHGEQEADAYLLKLVEMSLASTNFTSITVTAEAPCTECRRLNDELIRETHGHEPGLCEEYRCSSCRYCGREKPCPCSHVAAPSGFKKDFVQSEVVSAVSTITMFEAEGFETAVGLPVGGFANTGQWYPVERYKTAEEALEGHRRWLKLAPTLVAVRSLGLPGSEPKHVDLVAELVRLREGR